MAGSPLPSWRHARRNRRHSVPRALLTLGAGFLAFVVGGAGYAYWDLQNNITALDVASLVGSEETADADPSASPSETFSDPSAGKALTILVLGSDDRAGENGEIGGVDASTVGMRADTTILFHISADRSRVEAVSIPRDMMVAIPSCPLPDGSTSWAQSDAMFNSAITQGSQQSETGSDEAKQYGVACTIRTVQEMTGLTVDDYVLVDFAGFQGMIDAIGGVDVCIAEPLFDTYTGLDLPAGQMTLDGTQALQLARARHIVGTDGSDLQRIDRQQQLIQVMIGEVMEKNLLTDAAGLYRFLSAATSSLTMSPSIAQLPNSVGLAMSLNGLSMDSISFLTMPYYADGNRVRPQDRADDVWAALLADEPLYTVVPDLVPPPATPEPTDDADAGTGTPVETGTPSVPEATETASEPTPDPTSEPTQEQPLISARCG